MKLNFRQLEVFRAIMVAKTIVGAAELLHVSQPGVSRALKYIEMKVGVALFERRQNGLLPTPEAEELYREIQPLFNCLNDLDSSINRITQSENQVVQIACTPSLTHYVLPTLLLHAKQKMPEMLARIDTVSNEEIAEYITKRHCDFAFSTYEPSHPLILAEQSISGVIQCVVPKGHELTSLDSVGFKDVAKHHTVAYYDDTYIGRLLKNKFEELGLKPKISVQVRFNDDACAMVEHGLGVGFVYDFAIRESLTPNLKILPLTDEMPRIPVYLLRHRGFSFPNHVRSFYDYMIAELTAMNSKN